MENKVNRDEIETKLGEKINTVSLIKETSCSFLYYVKTERQYVLKESKAGCIDKEFDNHKIIYGLWLKEAADLSFRIPQVYFLSEDRKSYLMEYIQDGTNLLEVLLQKRADTAEIFKQAGRCLNQYHSFTTKHLADSKQNILEHNTIKQLLNSRLKNKVTTCLDTFSTDTYRIILKDFSPSNIVLDEKSNIFLLDFQNIYYYAPFYYDLARFIDTVKVFALVRRPMFFVLNFHKIKSALNFFLDAYSSKLDKSLLKKMQYLHRKEHIRMKANKSIFDSILLRLIYSMV